MTTKHWLARLLDSLRFERHDISRQGSEYLTRWYLVGSRYGPGQKLFIHLFYRGDDDLHPHDHPWPFWAIILFGGYWEDAKAWQVPQWFGPGSLLRRPALWQHRVILPARTHSISLVWSGVKERSWGFNCGDKWVHWSKYKDGAGCLE